MSLKASPVWTSTLTPSASSSSSSSSPTSRSLITSPPSLPLAIKQVGPQFARPAPYSSTNMPPAPAESATALKEEEGYEKPAETAIAGQATTTTITTTTNTTADNTAAAATQEAEDLSAAAAFAQSLSTVTTLDPAATKLIDQLRLQEYLRMVQPTTTSSSPSSAMASSIIASSTLF
ncbi:hypothetical protein EDD21DRAFT_386778 [Dissophora ornata]|nr:hypothetical protein EDD21DRAFT_386778 [Dissophora ornata]